MARDTLVGLGQKIARLEAQIDVLKGRDYNSCPLNELSATLLDRIDTLKMSMTDEICESEATLENLDRAYVNADSLDDQVRDLVL